MAPNLNLLLFKNRSIFEQLQIEEALLRLNSENWCIINEGSPGAIVMGISGKPETLVCPQKMKERPIPLIKRYSGGGTVIVDSNTLFVTLILQKEVLPCTALPESILRWTETFYQNALKIPGFHLRENDYAINDLKCGGNAQYLKKERLVHHTTFLWDYSEEAMHYLLYPPKTPNYRNGRPHTAFLTRLKESLPSKTHFIQEVKAELSRRFTVTEKPLNPLIPLLKEPHRQTTVQLTPAN